MGVRFVIGRAGSGKTSRCVRAITAMLRERPLGPAVYWIVPRQSTFQAERILTVGAGLAGYCRARVLSFDTLGAEVLAECGGSAAPQLTPRGRQMILGHLLRRNARSLRFFDGVARQPNLPAQVDRLLAEIEHAGKDPADLSSLVGDLNSPDVDGEALANKVHDLGLIFQAYCDFVGTQRLDPRGRMEQVLRCMDSSQRLRRSTVFVDGFAEFDELQRRMLARLGHVAERVEVMLLMDGASAVLKSDGSGVAGGPPRGWNEMGLFHHVEETYLKLLRVLRAEGVPVEPVEVLQGTHRYDSPSLGWIEQNLFEAGPAEFDAMHAAVENPHPNPLPEYGERGREPANAIELLEAPDKRSEVDAAARRIRQFMADGLRLRDIAVQVRLLEEYHDLIDASFREHGIRYFVDRRRSMAHHPLIQFVRSVLRLARGDWPHDALAVLIKSGLAKLSTGEADRLENYVLAHRIRGGKWADSEPWRYQRKLTRGEDVDEAEIAQAQQMDELRRRAIEPIRPLIDAMPREPGTRTVRELVTEVFALLDRFAVRATLAGWIAEAMSAGEIEHAEEHQQVWQQMVELCDELVELLGDEAMSLAELQEVMDSALESFDLALTPPTVDEVLVGQVDRTRMPEAKAVLVLGMNEGLFPHAPREDALLSDAERTELRRQDLDIEAESRRQLLDEQLLGYIAMTRASRHLVLSRALASDSGRSWGPSPFWRRLRECFPQLTPAQLPRDTRSRPELAGTPRALLTGLMEWVRAGGAGDAAKTWANLYHWMATAECDGGALDQVRYRVWRALGYANEARLSSESAAALFPPPLRASVSQMESFAACPFQNFVRYGLRLEREVEEDPTAIDLGNVYHQVLEKVARRMVGQKINWRDLDDEAGRALVRACADEVSATLGDEVMLSNKRNAHLLSIIRNTLDEVVASQRAVGRRGQFNTAYAELGFGFEKSLLPPLVLTTPLKRELQLHGKIDRVDILADHGAFVVVDYKLRANTLDLGRVYHGLSLQLLTYMLVLATHGKTLARRKLVPAAALYVQITRGYLPIKFPADPEANKTPMQLRDKPRGVIHRDFADMFDNEWDSGFSKVISARKTKQTGLAGAGDIVDDEQLAGLLRRVRSLLGQLADQMMDGRIEIKPYKLGTTSACAWCEYASVCRFDPLINGYLHLAKIGRLDALGRCMEDDHG